MVTGGPGSGRSSLLRDIARAEIMAGTDPDSLLFLTPSKDAASRVNRWLLHSIEQKIECGDGSRSASVSGESPIVERIFAESIARSVHSFAFAVVRHQAAHTPGAPAPRLLTGAEHDALVRDMLREHSDRGSSMWPERLRPALPTLGLARQLRDFLLRATERGCTSRVLREYGREWGRDEWVAAADFYDEYRASTRLMGANALNASELIRAAVDAIDTDDTVVDSLNYDVILIDDSQFFDPLSSELVDRCRARARLTVVASEQSESVFRFRGGSTKYADELAKKEHIIHLAGTKRMAAPVAELAARVADATGHPDSVHWAQEIRYHNAGRAGGAGPESGDTGAPIGANDTARGDADVRVLPSPSAEVAAIVDRVRRAHVVDGVPWRDIAVIVRSKVHASPIRRGLLSAGVPVADDPTDIVLSEQPMVRSIIQAVRCAIGEDVTNDELERMILSPIGGGDPVTFRRILRGLRRGFMKLEIDSPASAADLTATISIDSGNEGTAAYRSIDALRFILLGGELAEVTQYLSGREHDLIMRVRDVIHAGHDAFRRGDSIEAILWAVWDAAGVSDALANQSLRGGATGSMADRHLDAVMSLFDAAGDYVERHPHSTMTSFTQFITEQELPTGARDRRGPLRDAVDVSAAHATVGREWDTVVVAGVQEGVWPSLSETGSIFQQEEFVDLLDRGITPGRPENRRGRYDDRLAEERRLFLVAVSRARRSLLVTAVGAHAADDDTRSRFVEEITRVDGVLNDESKQVAEARQSDDRPGRCGGSEVLPQLAMMSNGMFPRVLSADSLIAELRRAVEASNTPNHLRKQAARQLARLALAAGDAPSRDSMLAGADPRQWWGVHGLSTEESMHEPGTAYRISPSQVERYLTCPATAFWDSMRAGQSETSSTLLGTLTHAAAEALEHGADEDDVRRVFLATVPRLLGEQAWKTAENIDEWTDVFTRLVKKLHQRDAAATGPVEIEKRIDAVIGQTESGDDVIVSGRIDRLEENDDGKFYIIDFKTGHQVREKDMVDQPQVKTYQIAVAQHCGGQAVSDRPSERSDHGDGQSSADNRLNGAELIFLKYNHRKPRVQQPLTNEEIDVWKRTLIDLAQIMAGPAFSVCSQTQLSTTGSTSLQDTMRSALTVGSVSLGPTDAP